MCGIAGELNFSGAAVAADVEAMTGAIAHRGPDDTGVWADGPVALGHRRLSIIDLSAAGRNPLWTADRAAVIVFNGEVYNYQAVRADLVREGCHFATGTDTEVVLVAVQHWGIERALQALIGMFAFAVWDTRTRQLILARDRVGVKPLFYARQGGRLLFGSEMRALYAHPAFSQRLDPRGLAQFFVLGYTAGATSVLSDTQRLPAGHYLVASPDGAVALHQYWTVAATIRGSFTGSFDDAAEELDHIADEAFGLRLVADVPVGVFLSGGIDSSFLAGVLKRRLGQDLLHVTIGFRQGRYDEAPMAAAIAKHLGVRHHVEYLDAPDAAAALTRFTDIYDEPFGDTSGIPTAMVAEVARRHVKVALSADGGDELFCGYESYPVYARRFLSASQWPLVLRRAAAAVAGLLPLDRLLASRATALTQAGGSPRLVTTIEKGIELLRANGAADVIRLMSEKGWPVRTVAEVIGRRVDGIMDDTVFAQQLTGTTDTASLIDAMMRTDFQAFMRDDVLAKVDRASMAVSLECRDPFVDHRLAEFAFSLPLDYHFAGGVHKRLLKHRLKSWVPDSVLSAPKRGFVIPLHEWMRGPWRPLVDAHLSDAEVTRVGVLDPVVVRREVHRFYSRPGIGAERVQLMLNFQMWAARWLRP